MAEPHPVNHEPSDDPWGSRIGTPAARTRVTWKRTNRAGIILLLVIPLGVLAGVAAFAGNDGDPSVPLVATIASIAIIAGVVGVVLVMAAYTWRRATIDQAFTYLKRRSPDITPLFVAGIIRSLDAFDSSYTPQRAVEFQDVPVVLPNWSPDIRRSILPGATEQSLVRIHRIVFFVAILGFIVMAGIGATGHFPSDSLWLGGWSVAALIVLVSFGFWVAAVGKGRREFRHGYTTAPLGASFPTDRNYQRVDAWSCLDFVDGKTGYLLRQSDEQLLTKSRWAERLRQIRSKHGGESPTRIQ